MKKISSFLPDNIINKTILIKKLNQFVIENFPKKIISSIKVVNVKDEVVIIGCRNSSLAISLKFERKKYLDILRCIGFQEVADLKIIVNN